MAGLGGRHVAAADVDAGGAVFAAGGGLLWLVIGQQDNDLGVIRRGEAIKETMVRPSSSVSEEPVLPPMRSARLIGVPAGALGHHALQNGPGPVAALLADDLPGEGGLRILEHRAAGVGDGLDHIADTGFRR